jgi:hypothetical protein
MGAGMGFLDRLKALGCRLGLIRAVPRRSDPLKKITPRVTSMKDLKTEVLQRDLEHLHDELSPSLEKVFEAAGIGHKDWTVERLRDMLRADPLRSMDRAAASQAILQALAADHARVDDLVQDARSRDRALDASEGRALSLTRERQEARSRRKEALQRQIGALSEVCRALDAEDRNDQQALQEWQARKAAYEKDMAWALGFLVDTPARFQAEPKKS